MAAALSRDSRQRRWSVACVETSAVMNKRNNVARLPTRLGAAERRTMDRVQTAVRDYVHTRWRLTEQLTQVDTAIEDGTAGQTDAADVSAVLRELAEMQSSLVRLVTSIDIGRGVVDGSALSTWIAEVNEPGAAPLPSTSERRPARQSPAVVDEPLSSVAELTGLGADSIVIQAPTEMTDRPRPHQRGDDGNWYGYGASGGVTSQTLWRRGDDLVVALRSHRPITAGATQRDRVEAEAAYRGWHHRDSGRGQVRFARDGVAIDVWFASVKRTVTKAVRTAADGTTKRAAAVGQLGTVLRWLAEQ